MIRNEKLFSSEIDENEAASIYPAANSTIAAISTPIGSGGVGIVKVSGPDSMTIAKRLFRPSSRRFSADADRDGLFESHRLYHGYWIDPDRNDRVIDEVLLAVMRAPHSYTREDVIEIQAHSGRVVLSAILDIVLKYGAELAKPGEFTQRAFINGRIDLTQAEAVIDVINARTAKSLEMANSLLKGDLKKRIETVAVQLREVLIEIEAAIDFPEEIDDLPDLHGLIDRLEGSVVRELEALVEHYENTRIFREGLTLAVVGRPNVGKSSLLNRLVKKDRAIVTDVPGTTRDIIEETVQINGIPVVISDTAGLHPTDDPIETIGIRKTHERIEESDVVLFVLEAHRPLSESDRTIYAHLEHRNVVLVINKIDLADDGADVDLPEAWRNHPMVFVSALYDRGIDVLADAIAALFTRYDTEERDVIAPNARQKNILDKTLHAVSSAVEGIQSRTPAELINIDIREALVSLGEITGETTSEDILDEIFGRFCIGK